MMITLVESAPVEEGAILMVAGTGASGGCTVMEMEVSLALIGKPASWKAIAGTPVSRNPASGHPVTRNPKQHSLN